MKTTALCTAALLAFSGASFAADEPVKQKAKDAWETTKEATKSAADAVKRGTEKVVGEVKDVVRDDEQKVPVKIDEMAIGMPESLKAGEFEFLVTNAGKHDHNFEIEGAGLDKKFWLNLKPGETKSLEVKLKPGEYRVFCPLKDHDHKGMTRTLRVE